MKLPLNNTPPGPAVNIERWYDRHTRSWVIERKDAQGNQIGNAEYVGSKREAILIETEWKREIAE